MSSSSAAVSLTMRIIRQLVILTPSTGIVFPGKTAHVTAPTSGHSSFTTIARRFRTELSLIIAFIAVVLGTIWLDQSKSYVHKPTENAKEVLRQTSILGIVALGATIVIISGGIDLSAGSVMAFSGVICGSIILRLAPQNARGTPLTENISVWITLAGVGGTLLVAVLVGTFHAWLITVVKLPPFVATLASLVGLRSLGRVIVQDVNLAITGESNTQMYVKGAAFRVLGQTVWVPLISFLFLSVLCWILLTKTVIGRHLLAMGGNEQAARLSGIRTDRLKWLAYCVGAVTAAMGGIMYSANVGQANPATDAVGFELNAIAAAVVGGCSLAGGIGTVSGTMLGALFLRTVMDSVAKTVKSKPDDFQGLIVGILVVLAVTLNEQSSGRSLQRRYFPGGLGVLTWLILSLLAGLISGAMSTKGKLTTGLSVGLLVAVLLGIKLLLERRHSGNKVGA